VIQLIYTSIAHAGVTPEALYALMVEARKRNAAVRITGILVHIEGAFLQVLEGEEAFVRPLFERIAVDRRHTRVTRLLVHEIKRRHFPAWSMGLFDRAGAGTGSGQPEFADLAGKLGSIRGIVDGFCAGKWRAA
jgi:hypothetical protein